MENLYTDTAARVGRGLVFTCLGVWKVIYVPHLQHVIARLRRPL